MIMAGEYTYEHLLVIEKYDPDGGETRPTEAQYAAHEAWAISQFGQAAWDRYREGGWGRESGYNDGGASDDYDY
jgi:hypothetical protein